MESIKPLPEAVHSVLRSGFIIGNLTTVIEELIYNSLDAGATKVLVYVGVSNGYVKVEDDGCGISRDGLVLLGERYATSKLHHLHDKDDDVQIFGFRGEVLCSIADTSLIEIMSKVHGRPNGYRKVMKGRKRLYLSVDDDRQEAGTTVIARDLFYNQPVRRRQIQSSAKKVLHSVKKCVVRIALVRSRVSFKLVDMESEEILFWTHPSFSPLPLLCSNFGFEVSSLKDLSFSQCSLKLKGYVSSPSSSFSLKAIQYIYVNSRFIVKGPIHKALNRLADMCWEQLSGDKRGKKGYTHTGPTYCLNLTCPRSSYDLNLEFSRTSVEFKDWAPVLTFIEKSVMTVWGKKTKKGDSYDCEADQNGSCGKEKLVENNITVEKDWLLKACQRPAKRSRIQNTQNEPLSAKPSLNPGEMQVQDGSNLSFCQDIDRQNGFFLRNTAEFGEAETDYDFSYKMDSFKSVGKSIDKCLLEPSKGLKLLNEDLFENDVTTVQRGDDDYGDFLPSSRWEDGLRIDVANARNSEAGRGWDYEFLRHNDQLQTLSSEVQASFKDKKNPRFQIKNSEVYNLEFVDSHCLSHNISDFQRLESQNGLAQNSPLSKLCIESDMWKDAGITSLKCHDSLSYSESFYREHTPDYLSKQVVSTSCFSPNTDQHFSYPFLNTNAWDLQHLIQDGGLERRSSAGKFNAFEQSNDDKEEFYHDYRSDSFSHESSFTAHLNSSLIFRNEDAEAGKGTSKFSPHGHSVDDISTVRFDNIFSEEPYLSCKDRKERNYGYPSSICWSLSESADIEAQIDARKCEAFSPDHTPRDSFRRNHHKHTPADLFSANSSDILADEIFSPLLDLQRKYDSIAPSVPLVSSLSIEKGPEIDIKGCQAFEQNSRFSRQSENSSSRLKRSHSAPPFYKAKKRLFSIGDYCISTAKRPTAHIAPRICNVTDLGELEHTTSSQHVMSHGDDSLFSSEKMVKETSNITQIGNISQDDMAATSCCSPGNIKSVWSSKGSLSKWRENCLDARLEDIANYQRVGDCSNQLKDENTILDLDSCMSYFARDSLVPKSINRSCLESAKVLLQIDRKFIPVVAGDTLAVIDQHAADERIRLEEMRKKILSGEMNSRTYLEEEKDLVLPEMAYQLLCNYAERVQHWGWICNIFCQDSGSFNKNLNLLNNKPMHLSLLAVPCILGVNLSDADLLEFLEQLADTDGSSIIPPAILRILNYKACRGAIMFGDRLLPSECNLIVEELKRTSLCFQCAHGRPTTVPVVNLEALHKGIAQLRACHESSKSPWHGLCRKEISLERATHRLGVARFCG